MKTMLCVRAREVQVGREGGQYAKMKCGLPRKGKKRLEDANPDTSIGKVCEEGGVEHQREKRKKTYEPA